MQQKGISAHQAGHRTCDGVQQEEKFGMEPRELWHCVKLLTGYFKGTAEMCKTSYWMFREGQRQEKRRNQGEKPEGKRYKRGQSNANMRSVSMLI